MRTRSALLLASILGTSAAQVPADESNLIGPLTIVIRSDRATPPGVLNAIEREVESAVAPSGIRVSWILSADHPQVYNRVAVLRLRGVCLPGAPIPAASQVAKGEPEPLGQTQVVDGKVLPFADVRCDAVRKLIARDLNATPKNEREDLLGRALGRVMAHELYHVLLRTTSHARNGLARPTQTSADLVANRGSFAQADERKLSESAGFEAGDPAPASGR